MLSAKTRRRARERAMQFLFGLDFQEAQTASSPETPFEEDVSARLGAFWQTYPAKPRVKDYAQRLVEGVLGHRQQLDEAIGWASEHWSLDRIGRVERNVLRVALYEMRYAEDIPANVAINEAVEIARRYGADEAPRFVNGVLDRLKETEPRQTDT